MIYGSVCSGIEAPTVAWHPLGWRPAFFSEIAAFPSRVLAHHFPDVPNHGDFTTITAERCAGIDLLVGGTPCQDFSIAGLRAGMGGERGALALEFLRLAARARPRWIVWENVPGVLSSDRGRALGAFLGGLAELGYGFAWRVLDAQYFGLAQRRKRLFVVGHAGGQWQRAAAVLLERSSLRGDPAPSRSEGASVAGCLEARARSGGHDPEAHGAASGHLIPLAVQEDGQNGVTMRETAGALRANAPGSQPGGSLVFAPIPFDTTQVTSRENRSRPEPAPTLSRGAHAPAIAFHCTQDPISGGVAPAAGAESSGSIGVMHGAAVRRLTPRECERLMGFPETEQRIRIRVCEESEWRLCVGSADRDSLICHLALADAARLSAFVDAEREVARLSSRERSVSLASSAGESASCLLPTGIASFARLAALTMGAVESAILAGRAASPPSTKPSTLLLSGSRTVLVSGREIVVGASDAARAIREADHFITSTMSQAGRDSPISGSTLGTLCSCVVAAIDSCIPRPTSGASSYEIDLTISRGYTAIPGAKDGPRYAALGNSIAVPVLRWIGERIERVDAISAEESAA